jgi:NADH-quinone oxidoreductase subunit F
MNPTESQPHRVLEHEPITSLSQYIRVGGGAGLDAARALGPAELIGIIGRAGLRGRGGAGFPTGEKWRAVARRASPWMPATVVVNGAEGEPGTFKDRMIMRRNPQRVVEGALIAAHAVGADTVVFALKSSFGSEIARMRTTIHEMRSAGMTDGVDLSVVEGPSEYLFGEETALLEVIAGRQPFPRVAPPFRAGLESSSAATAVMAAEGDATVAPPTLVNNVETLANVPAIVARGPGWFREVGTDKSPGTVVCTITGRVRRHGVGEVEMGTPLRDVIEAIGHGPLSGREVIAALSGVSNPLLPAARHDTPLTYEDMKQVGSGLGAAGFIVLDDATDVVAVARDIARFLAVESCGQCTPCKSDGLAIARHLDDTVGHPTSGSRDPEEILVDVKNRLTSVTDGARCHLAHQQAAVVGSFLRHLRDDLRGSTQGVDGAAVAVAPIVDIVDGVASVDMSQSDKQPDWSHGSVDSGAWPAQLYESSETPV